MDAFLQGRKPNFQKFRMKNKRELESYLAGCERDPQRAAFHAQEEAPIDVQSLLPASC